METREQRHKRTYSDMDVETFCKRNAGVKNMDGSWSFKRDLILRRKSPIVKNGQFIIKIKDIASNFNCSGQGLTTLKNGPENVGGNFWCENNRLTSLIHGPKYVKGTYSFSYNKIKSLKHLPEQVAALEGIENQLTSLKYLPKIVKLEWGSIYVDVEIDLSNNLIESIEGIKIEHTYSILNVNLQDNKLVNINIKDDKRISLNIDNNLLTDLKTFPIVYLVSVYGNKITSLEGYASLEGGIMADDAEVHYLEQELCANHQRRKKIKNYHSKLLSLLVERQRFDDIENINWPEGFLNKKKNQQLINSGIGVAKFDL